MESEAWWKALDGLGLGGEWRDGVGRWGKKNGCWWLAEEGGEFNSRDASFFVSLFRFPSWNDLLLTIFLLFNLRFYPQ